MKKLIILGSFFLSIINIQAQVTNNSNVPINIVMYANYIAPANGKSAKGRLNEQGILIEAGQNISLMPGTTSIDIYYSNNQPGIHAEVNTNYDYTINPGTNIWTLTQDFK